MQSKTSFFNAAIFKNSITRFWPMWVAYAFVWALSLPMTLSSSLEAHRLFGFSPHISSYANENIFSTSLYGGLSIGLFSAAIVSMAIWSFMYNSRSASGMAALPVSRGGMFVSVMSAGLLPAVIINFIISLITFAVTAYYGVSSFFVCMQSFFIITLIYIMCFGLATLCAQLTGSTFTLPAVFAVLNMVVFIVRSLIEGILHQFVYGFTGFSAWWTAYLSPPVGIVRGCGVSYDYVELDGIDSYISTFFGWGCLAIYAFVGLLLIAASFFLFKRRRMETAGDVVAVRALKPVFKYAMTFGCALVFGVFMSAIWFSHSGSGIWSMIFMLVFMLFGAFIGYYASEMLMRKSFRVFKGSGSQICISFAIIIAFMFAFEFDLFSIERHTPNPSKVSSAYISLGDTTVDEAAQIEALIALHERLVADKADNELRSQQSGLQIVSLRIEYTLENGSVLRRYYNLAFSELRPTPTEDGGIFQLLRDLDAFINSPELTFARVVPHFEVSGAENITDCWINYGTFVPYDEMSFNVDDYFGSYEYYYEKYGTASDKEASLFHFPIQLSREEAFELYTTCILPDAADGTLGLVNFLYDENYFDRYTNCDIQLQFQSGFGEDHMYASIYIAVTVDAVRTLAWLEARGIAVYALSTLGITDEHDAAPIPATVITVSDEREAENAEAEPIGDPLATVFEDEAS